MTTKNKNHDFLIQGGTLAAAAILGRIIGLIYRIPLTNIIGDLGNNYYGCAFDIYNILLLISSYSLPMAVSRLVSDYHTKGELNNAYRVLKCAFVFAAAAGTAVFALVFFGAKHITASIFQTPFSVLALQVLAPTLIITALSGVFRGFFQGMQNMNPSAVSQVLEQLVNAVVSVLAAYVLSSYGARLGRVLANEEDYHAAYGAAGASLGTTVGALTALLFLYILYKGYFRTLKRKMRRMRRTDVPYKTLARGMILTILPILAASALYNINIVIEQGIFKHMMKDAASQDQIALWWGVFSGKMKTLVNLPTAVAAAIGAACIPSITASHRNQETEEVTEKTELAIRFSMLIAFPSAFALMLLAAPIMDFLFRDADPLASGLLLAGGITVIFYSLSTVTASILQGIGKLWMPVVNSAIALGLHVLTLTLLLKYTKLGIYAVIIAMIVFGICVTILNQTALRSSGFWRPEFVKTYFMPALCAAIMAAACWVLEFGLSQLIPSRYITLPIAVLFGVWIYFCLLLILRALTPEEMCLFPGGKWIWKSVSRIIGDKKHNKIGKK